MKEKKQPENLDQVEEAKRILIVEQFDDATIRCHYQGIIARQHLLPMLRAAEKQFRIKLNREALGLPANPASPAEKGE